jgi:membrane protease YdiL (CAAX protease family)
MSAGFFEVLLVFSLACMWAPIVEETLFRGAFQHYLRRRWSIPLTTLVVAFVFAAIHPQGYLGVPPLMAIGATLSLVREWRGSLIAPIVTHACNNTVMLTLVLLLFR